MNRLRAISLTFLAAVVLWVAFVPNTWANHRTGRFALPELIAAADFNGDGNLDLAALVTGWDAVAIFIGDGHGGLTLEGHLAADTLPRGIAVGDINEDGRQDLVVCNSWGYSQSVFFGDGLGGFVLVAELDGHEDPTRVVLKDFDADGHLDIGISGKRDVRVFQGDGLGNFEVPARIFSLPRAHSLAVADFNRDGNLDMAVTRGYPAPGKSQVSVLLGDGLGDFAVKGFPAVNDRPNSVAVGDLNEDGIPDVVVAGAQLRNTSGNFVSTYLGDGVGAFSTKTTITLGRGRQKGEMAVGDFNEDRHLDVAVPQTGGPERQGNTVLLFFGDGTGLLSPGVPLVVGSEPHTAIAADFNRDGHLDLAVSNRTDATISVLLGDGAGSFIASGPFSVVPRS